ncbi:MAG TPA: Fe-S-containing hydro-lyase [Clostridiales bacterium UBA8153]|nr:Fe-S-containing hydro-lyase [Clostridiales bacterium UBA8153]
MKTITTPVSEQMARSLAAGERVLITGTIYTGRDAAHKRMVEALDRGEGLPVDLEGQLIFYVGPCPAKPGQAIGSAGPTTSGRMDAYAPRLMAAGLRGMIGKGLRQPAVVEAMKRYGCVYLVAVGGAGALLAQKITKAEVVAFPDLGPEAIHRLQVENFPVFVGIDAAGTDMYAEGVAKYRRM